ncbi:hypothetical protein JAAARDRAFT_253840 [Jaapia argillacea MUCL 33604]|uniref:Uncharacterized protein n=1 Tax=Jaapia argillacea MUCL 33604 TaxID=933084 RepID=A0A067Q5X9_9AGAM|nr:hypothetical protein JAAARDRAFT_253840 [Jaapia argillacea MUCL 33604]
MSSTTSLLVHLQSLSHRRHMPVLANFSSFSTPAQFPARVCSGLSGLTFRLTWTLKRESSHRVLQRKPIQQALLGRIYPADAPYLIVSTKSKQTALYRRGIRLHEAYSRKPRDPEVWREEMVLEFGRRIVREVVDVVSCSDGVESRRRGVEMMTCWDGVEVMMGLYPIPRSNDS